MLNSQPSVVQKDQQYKGNVAVFSPFSEQKIQAQKEAKKQATAVITNIAQTIFERFGCGSSFNDDCIKNFGEMYDPANFKIGLLNFQPTKSIFAFLLSIHASDFLRISNECKFYTDEAALMSKFEVSYSFLVCRNSEFIMSKIFVVFDSNFDIQKIHYRRINGDKETLVDVSKTKDMLCSVDEEMMFIELFLNSSNCDVQDLFQSFYVEGAYTFDMNEIESNMTIARMLVV
jgi:hypothetical protein